MIKPTVGRVVWLRRPADNTTGQPEAALITYVHSDTCINAAGWNCNGTPISVNSLLLVQEDAPAPEGYEGPYAEWMPYQKGQPAKTEALEAAQGKGNAV